MEVVIQCWRGCMLKPFVKVATFFLVELFMWYKTRLIVFKKQSLRVRCLLALFYQITVL